MHESTISSLTIDGFLDFGHSEPQLSHGRVPFIVAFLQVGEIRLRQSISLQPSGQHLLLIGLRKSSNKTLQLLLCLSLLLDAENRTVTAVGCVAEQR